jgi:hypothetical protein
VARRDVDVPVLLVLPDVDDGGVFVHLRYLWRFPRAVVSDPRAAEILEELAIKLDKESVDELSGICFTPEILGEAVEIFLKKRLVIKTHFRAEFLEILLQSHS